MKQSKQIIFFAKEIIKLAKNLNIPDDVFSSSIIAVLFILSKNSGLTVDQFKEFLKDLFVDYETWNKATEFIPFD